MSEKYAARKKLLKGIIGLSTDIDDSLDGYKRELLLLVVKFSIVLLTISLIIYGLIANNYIQVVIFTIIMLTSFLAYLQQIKKYRLVKTLYELKCLREKK